MRLYVFIIISLVIVSCSKPEITNPIDQLKADVALLASDSLEGREVGTIGEDKAAAYLASRLKNLGLEPKGTDGYLQAFYVNKSNNPHEKESISSKDSLGGIAGENVIGYINNPGDEIIILGAHFDHLGYGGLSSLYRGDSAIHNGADDNASGTAALLYLAEELLKKPIQRDVMILAFSGEEKGLWGSNYFSKNPTIDLEKVDYMINMDMIGRLDTAKGIAIHGVGTAPNWSEEIDQANTFNLKVIKKESGVGPSDHTSFYLQDIPVLHYFTGQHEDYHRPSDDVDLINFEGIKTVADHILNVVRSLEDQPKLAFQKTKDESKSGPKFTVTLGVVPDYMFDGKGVRIDGVSEDKPAQKAGLVKGDVVVQLGDSTVTDMMSYMRALSSFSSGDKTVVKVKRDKEELAFDIQF